MKLERFYKNTENLIFLTTEELKLDHITRSSVYDLTYIAKETLGELSKDQFRQFQKFTNSIFTNICLVYAAIILDELKKNDTETLNELLSYKRYDFLHGVEYKNKKYIVTNEDELFESIFFELKDRNPSEYFYNDLFFYSITEGSNELEVEDLDDESLQSRIEMRPAMVLLTGLWMLVKHLEILNSDRVDKAQLSSLHMKRACENIIDGHLYISEFAEQIERTNSTNERDNDFKDIIKISIEAFIKEYQQKPAPNKVFTFIKNNPPVYLGESVKVIKKQKETLLEYDDKQINRKNLTARADRLLAKMSY